jgi:hypothetical protein
LLPAGASWPGGVFTHWKDAAFARRTPSADVKAYFQKCPLLWEEPLFQQIELSIFA